MEASSCAGSTGPTSTLVPSGAECAASYELAVYIRTSW